VPTDASRPSDNVLQAFPIDTEALRAAETGFREQAVALCAAYQELEDRHAVEHGRTADQTARFVTIPTRRTSAGDIDPGGGIMRRMIGGAVFEKVAVNVSTVSGRLSPELIQLLAARKDVSGLDSSSRFWASGVSMVAHPLNPHAPAGHFNTRLFATPVGWWFGGSADLNPSIPYRADTEAFHAALRETCDQHDADYYTTFSQWAERYFHIPHRGCGRGIGGVFFDDLCTEDWAADFAFVRAIGTAFLASYVGILDQRRTQPWTDRDRQTLLEHRGRYVEFNLLYDRGTRFGLQSGHDADAVLMSLPPVATWQ